MKSFWRAAFAVGLAMVLAACSTARQGGGTTASAFGDEPASVGAIPVSANLGDSVDYRIGPMDIIAVAVFQVAELGATVQVSESGQVTLPLLGQVKASGKTAMQLQKDIAVQLGSKYLQSPQVTVSVKEMLSQRVTIEGAIKKPGVYPTTGKTTLMQIIALAGGLDETAEARGIIVLRGADRQRQAAKFDYTAIRSGNSDDPVIVAGDVVVIDDSRLKTVWRDLRTALPVFGFFKPFIF